MENTPAQKVIDPSENKTLSVTEKKQLSEYEGEIREAASVIKRGFQIMAQAFYRIREQRLYREHGTFAQYFQTTFGYGRSHSSRIADAGELIEILSPQGDKILEKFTSEAHFRPLMGFRKNPERQQQVIEVLKTWSAWGGEGDISPREVTAAAVIVNPPLRANDQPSSNKLAEEFFGLIENAERQLPSETSQEIRNLFEQMKAKTASIVTPRTSEIEWTQITWNPLQGCSRASEGCDRCYAAKLLATRMADLYPGLAIKNGHSYMFTGKIVLVPERLGDPLLNKTPSKIFVNSLSDLFHKNVPEEFIDQVFDVMEKAHWHQFQVLTKRPERMASYTQKRYRHKEPMSHIWLGCSTENQEWYDNRISHLRAVKASVRWLSCEPLLGPIDLGNPHGIDWLVVGGESKGGRPMKKQWATGLRDQCKKGRIPFYFKQWGDHDELGNSQKEKKTGGAVLDRNIHHEYPKK